MLLIFVIEHKHLRNRGRQASERDRMQIALFRTGLNVKYVNINAPDLIVAWRNVNSHIKATSDA